MCSTPATEVDAARLRLHAHELRSALERRRDVEGLPRDLELPRLDLREVEDVVDEDIVHRLHNVVAEGAKVEAKGAGFAGAARGGARGGARGARRGTRLRNIAKSSQQLIFVDLRSATDFWS
jgi:hypothetical protein